MEVKFLLTVIEVDLEWVEKWGRKANLNEDIQLNYCLIREPEQTKWETIFPKLPSSVIQLPQAIEMTCLS